MQRLLLIAFFFLGCGGTSDPSIGHMNPEGPPPSTDPSTNPSTDPGKPPGGAPGSTAPPPSANASLPELMTQSAFETMFPNRNALFRYQDLLAAAAYYPQFAASGTVEDRKRELAAFLANISHETTGGWDTAPGGRYAWGLYFSQEVGCENGACTQYCDSSNTTYPCTAGKTYHGRGPIQLSWNYNYGQAGAALGVDLLGHPELVATDGAIAFRTALWFWMTAQDPKPSCHDAILGTFTATSQDLAAGRKPGFGLTIDIINGGVECGYATPDQVRDRVGYYQVFTKTLGVTTGENLYCDTMRSF